MNDEHGAHPGYPGHPEAPTYPGYPGSPFLHQLPFQPYPLAKHSELKLIPLTRMIRLCKVINPEQYRTNAETHTFPAERLMQMAYWPNFAICPWDYPCVVVEIPELKQDGHENQCLWRETTVGMLVSAWLQTEWGRKIAYPNEPWVNLWT